MRLVCQNQQFIGFSVKNFDELERTLGLGANMAELKAGDFAKAGFPLYFYENGKFRENEEVLTRIRSYRLPRFQLHLPIERSISLDEEAGISVGVREHHEAAFSRFRLLEDIRDRYGIGHVITMHPPPLSFNGKRVGKPGEILENARIFFERLDEERYEKCYKSFLGIENMPNPKTKAGNVGYMPAHFKTMLRNTRTIGLTMDTGHRRLTKKFTVREFLQLGIPFVNFHFHGNHGVFKKENYADDEHLLPTEQNVKGFKNYIRYFRRHRTPMTLEIANLKEHSDEELSSFIREMKKKVDC